MSSKKVLHKASTKKSLQLLKQAKKKEEQEEEEEEKKKKKSSKKADSSPLADAATGSAFPTPTPKQYTAKRSTTKATATVAVAAAITSKKVDEAKEEATMASSTTAAAAPPADSTSSLTGKKRPRRVAKSIVQKLPQRKSGRCYFAYNDWYKIPIFRNMEKTEGQYLGEWTITCKKAHVHNKQCKQQIASGFGKLTYQLNGKEMMEEGYFRRGQLVTELDSSDSDVEEPSENEAEEEKEEEEAEESAVEEEKETKASEVEAADDDEVMPPAEEEESKVVDEVNKKPKQIESAKKKLKKTTSVSELPAKKKHKPSSSPAVGSKKVEADPPPKSKKKQLKQQQQSKSPTKSELKLNDEWEEKANQVTEPPTVMKSSKIMPGTANVASSSCASSKDCVLFRCEPKASSLTSLKNAPKSRLVREKEAVAFENAAARAAEARSKGKALKCKGWSSDGWTYRGSMKDGKRHGFGVTTFDSGSVYRGHYVNDRCSGDGTWTSWENGEPSRYSGMWLNDVENGAGELSMYNPELGRILVRGTWTNGESHGLVHWIMEDTGHAYFSGEMNFGEFLRGRVCSSESMGEIYEGEFKDQQYWGTGCLRYADGVYFYGSFVRHDPYGPGLVIKPIIDTDTPIVPLDEEDSSLHVEPVTKSTQFRVFPVFCRNDQVNSRWILKSQLGIDEVKRNAKTATKKRTTSDEEKKQEIGTTNPIDEASEKMIWKHMRQLMRDGLRQVLHLQHELAERGAAVFSPTNSNPTVDVKPLSEDLIASLISSHVSEFDDSSQYSLIHIPNSIFNGIRHGVCAYRITDEAGGPEQPFVCHTCTTTLKLSHGEQFEICKACATTCSCHSGHSVAFLPAVRDFICDCGRLHRHAQEEQAAEKSKEGEEKQEPHSCPGMLANSEKVFDRIPLPKSMIDFVQQRGEQTAQHA